MYETKIQGQNSDSLGQFFSTHPEAVNCDTQVAQQLPHEINGNRVPTMLTRVGANIVHKVRPKANFLCNLQANNTAAATILYKRQR